MLQKRQAREEQRAEAGGAHVPEPAQDPGQAQDQRGQEQHFEGVLRAVLRAGLHGKTGQEPHAAGMPERRL